MENFLVVTDTNVTFKGSMNLRECAWVFEGKGTTEDDIFKLHHSQIHLIALPKGSQPRCKYCKRRLVFHNNGDGVDCLKQLSLL